MADNVKSVLDVSVRLLKLVWLLNIATVPRDLTLSFSGSLSPSHDAL